MYGNYFPYGQFGINSRGMSMMPHMARAAGNSFGLGARGAGIGNAMMRGAGNTAIRNPGLLSNLFNGIKSMNWGGLLTNTQKTLGIVNQAIPVYHQVKPLYNNVKTAVRVFRAVNKDSKNDSSENNVTSTKTSNTSPDTNTSANNNNTNTGPNFFL